MDFLDPNKRKIRSRQIFIGYFLLGTLIILATVILVYLSYGFGIDKNGQVYQNGLIYLSSQPTGSNVSINGTGYGQTDKSLSLPSGEYLLKISRSGYHDWKKSIEVDGASVQHFDYPLLVPNKLTSTPITKFDSAPKLTLQSPDRRWLLIEDPAIASNFTEYDLNTKPIKSPAVLSLPTGLLSPGSNNDSLQLAEWSTDNIHVILKHSTANGDEYILFDRKDPVNSINLNRNLNIPIGQMSISLWDNSKYNQFYAYDSSSHDLYSTTLSSPNLKLLYNSILSFKSYANNIILFAQTDQSNPSLVNIKVAQGKSINKIRNFTAGSSYLLDLAQNSGNWFYLVGSTLDSKVYVYENPIQNLQQNPTQPLAPVNVLKVPGVNYIKFSEDTRNILAENGLAIETYDDFANKNYTYTLTKNIDNPQSHVSWMDGERLIYTSDSSIYMIDYDGINMQKLASNLPDNIPRFNQNYFYLYSLSPVTTTTNNITTTSYALIQTPMRIPADL